MKIDFDKDADAVYIYVKDRIEEGEVDKTVSVNGDIVLDFDKEDKLLGIEVLNASKNVSKEFIKETVA